MAKRSRKAQKTAVKAQELSFVTLASSKDEAKGYKAMLEANDIPVTTKAQHGSPKDSDGIAILVPEEFVGQAQVVIESQNAYDDFDEYSFDDEDYDDDFNEDFNEDFNDDYSDDIY